MMHLLMLLSTFTSSMFMQMKYPLIMGLMLLLQTIFLALISGLLSQSFWFSYILFLIFLGGMLILFMYVTSLAPNELFYPPTKIIVLSMLSTILMWLMYTNINIIQNNELINLLMQSNSPLYNSLHKLYNYPTNIVTITLVLYLFLTLITVVKIINISKGPLRQFN